jgi:hypothetical protein
MPTEIKGETNSSELVSSDPSPFLVTTLVTPEAMHKKQTGELSRWAC